MLTIGYKKTAQGMRVVSVEEIDLNKKPTDPIDRFHTFFDDVPIFGGKEWETLTPEQIVEVFKEAATEFHNRSVRRHEEVVSEHTKRNPIIRWWRERRGWHAPKIASVEQIEKEMANQCRELATWMRTNQRRPFYAGSDMSRFIVKPEAVAKILDPST